MNALNKNHINFKLLITFFIIYSIVFNCKEYKDKKIQKVVISKAKAIEIVFSSLVQGKENQFYNDYFPKVSPILSKYKGKILFASAVHNSYDSKIKSQAIAFLEWPDVESFINITKDHRMPELLKIRNDALSYMNEANFYKSNKNKTLNLYSDKVYSLVSVPYKSFFINEIKKNNGKIILTLELLPESIGEFKEEKVYLIEWNKNQNIETFYNNSRKYNNKNFLIISFMVN